MTGDQWTFLVVRGRNGPIKQFSLPLRTLRYAAGAAALVATGLLVFALGLGLDGTAALRANRLAVQNEALQVELQSFQARVARLEGAFDRLAEQDAAYRTVAGLETIDPEVMEVGVGGPGLGTPEAYPLWWVDSTTSKSVFALSYDLNALERRARLLSESLAEATDTVLADQQYLAALPSIPPTSGWWSSSFSRERMHPIHQRPLPHPGVDIAAPKGTPIYASAGGTVVTSGWIVGYGQTVEIDHGYGYRTLYGHASQILVTRGQKVERGAVIARVGDTGIATAPHVHYEVRVNGVAQDPDRFMLPGARSEKPIIP